MVGFCDVAEVPYLEDKSLYNSRKIFRPFWLAKVYISRGVLVALFDNEKIKMWDIKLAKFIL